MEMDLTPFFVRYEYLAKQADTAFQRIKKEYPDLVVCGAGCTDCCYALFDLSLVEAMYINQKFNEKFEGEEREQILERANKVDREVYRIKRASYKAVQAGEDEESVIEHVGKKKIRCPLLNDENMCELYEHRPVACRIYGVPLAIGGRGRVCGKSGFDLNRAYPVIQVDRINEKLAALSAEIAAFIRSSYQGLADVLVPLSMALLTEYDEEYLGVKNNCSASRKETRRDVNEQGE